MVLRSHGHRHGSSEDFSKRSEIVCLFCVLGRMSSEHVAAEHVHIIFSYQRQRKVRPLFETFQAVLAIELGRRIRRVAFQQLEVTVKLRRRGTVAH